MWLWTEGLAGIGRKQILYEYCIKLQGSKRLEKYQVVLMTLKKDFKFHTAAFYDPNKNIIYSK